MTLKGQINFENILIHQGYLDQQVILKLFAVMIASLENLQDGGSQGGFQEWYSRMDQLKFEEGSLYKN